VPSPAQNLSGGPAGWRDEQLPDGTIVWTSPTGRIYKTTPAGYDLFPQLRQACRAPTPRKRNHSKEQAKRIARARKTLREQRPVNAGTRRVNYAIKTGNRTAQVAQQHAQDADPVQRQTGKHQPLFHLDQRALRTRRTPSGLETTTTGTANPRRRPALLTRGPCEQGRFAVA
jgi:hypothetical protein